MPDIDPIDFLFADMAKLGPGADADTLHVLGLLPERQFPIVVDAGCGTGRQTLALARALGTEIQAIDSHAPFLDQLAHRARAAGVSSLVHTHHMDMADIPTVFADIDLLWAEGAAYNIGFANALATWAGAIRRGGYAVISELAWLHDGPEQVRAYFRSAYPDMQETHRNMELAVSAGYSVIATHTLPSAAWQEDYYDILYPRALALAGHPDPAVAELAAETIKEIDTFRTSQSSYGYVFYVLRRN